MCLGKFIRTLGVEENVEQTPVVQKVDSAIHRINHYSVDTGADVGGGCRGCAPPPPPRGGVLGLGPGVGPPPPPPPRGDLRLSNNTGILQKNLCGLLVLK